MAKLNQIIAVANGQKGRTSKVLTEAYHKIQKDALLAGITRRYHPRDEEGETLPPESKRVQYRVKDALTETRNTLTELFDVVLTQDSANCKAKSDVVVDGVEVLKEVPVTSLLFLEKQLTDIHTMLGKLPVLDPAEEWRFSEEADCYCTDTHKTVRTKKLAKPFVKYEATPEHPAQVDVVTEDVVVGDWETINFSGAIPESEKRQMLDRVKKLQDAVKFAREDANTMEVDNVKIGEKVFNFILN